MPSTITDRLNGLTTSVAVKAPCRVTTTANITLSGLQTIDGVTLVALNRVLVKDQTDATENGIWLVASGAWSRASDFNGSLDVVCGTVVAIAAGTDYAGTFWRVTTTDEIVIGTSSITFAPSDLTDLGFSAGRTTPIAASYAAVEWVRENSASPYQAEDMGALWSDKVYYNHVISADYAAANSPVTTPRDSPAVTFMVASHNTGSDAIVLPLQTISGIHANGKEGTSGNFITYSGAGTTNIRMKGVEIDLQPDATSTITEAFGLAINAFTKAIPGPAIYIEGVFGGSWATGINIGNLSNIGAGIAPASGTPSMGTLVDTGTATYAIAAIALSNTHRQIFRSTAGNPGQIYADASNFLRVVASPSGVIFRDNNDTASLTLIDPANGSVDIQGGGVFKKGSTQVVGARDTGWTAMTGSPDKATAYNTGTVTLAQLAGRVAQIQASLTTHGLLGA